jgi:hypothetical protein
VNGFNGRGATPAICALLIATLALSWWGGLDRAAAARTHAAFERALVTFALARTLNGVISVAQGTELAFEPAGVGVVLSAGQILDPLNDLVEQFSDLTLLAVTSLGLQIMLGEMFASVAVNVALSVAVVTSMIFLWWRPTRFKAVGPALLRLTLAFLFLRFAIALVTFGTGLVDEHFLAQREEASVAVLSQTSARAETADTTPVPPGTSTDSVLERLNKFIDDQRQALDIEGRLAGLKASVETGVEQIINLIVVYIIETLLLPLGFLVVAWAMVKSAWRRIT